MIKLNYYNYTRDELWQHFFCEMLLLRLMPTAEEKVSAVRLLGYNDQLEWKQTTDGLAVILPGKQPCDNAFVLKIV